mgnify:CR=1 FL=1
MAVVAETVVRADERDDRARAQADGAVHDRARDVALLVAGRERAAHVPEHQSRLAAERAIARDVAVGEQRARARQRRFDAPWCSGSGQSAPSAAASPRTLRAARMARDGS